MQGVLLVDKPAGWTSFDVVNYTRGIVARVEGKKPKNVKVGHSGTLDPFATGLLILLVGKTYTARASDYTKLDKTYELTMMLGSSSSTGDSEGVITEVNSSQPLKIDIEKVIKKFRGEISQVPPIYSAIKVNGHRAYKLARAGQSPKLEPRTVKINQLELIDYSYPLVKLRAKVSSGTYIRSLVEDIGRELGTAAYTSSLRRLAIKDFEVSQAIEPKQLNEDNLDQFIRQI